MKQCGKKKNHWIEEIKTARVLFPTWEWQLLSEVCFLNSMAFNTNILGFKSRDHCKIAPEGSVISFPKAREGNETRGYTSESLGLPIVMVVAYNLHLPSSEGTASEST